MLAALTPQLAIGKMLSEWCVHGASLVAVAATSPSPFPLATVLLRILFLQGRTPVVVFRSVRCFRLAPSDLSQLGTSTFLASLSGPPNHATLPTQNRRDRPVP